MKIFRFFKLNTQKLSESADNSSQMALGYTNSLNAYYRYFSCSPLIRGVRGVYLRHFRLEHLKKKMDLITQDLASINT